MVTWEWKSVKQGGTKSETRGKQGQMEDCQRWDRNRMEVNWRGKMEVEQRRGGAEQSCWRSISDLVSNSRAEFKL